MLTRMGILDDLISVDDGVVRLIALHRRLRIVILVSMDLAKGRMTGIDMGRIVEHRWTVETAPHATLHCQVQ